MPMVLLCWLCTTVQHVVHRHEGCCQGPVSCCKPTAFSDCICVLNGCAAGQKVWAASGTGHMQLWVLKTNKLMDALKDAGGSVRTLALYPGPEPWLASVGLDRFLRMHDASTKAAKGRVYLKQQLTSVVWLPVQQPAAPTAAAAGDGAAAEAAAGIGAGPSGSSKKKKSRSKGSKHRHDGAEGEEGEGVAAAEVKQKKKRQKQEV